MYDFIIFIILLALGFGFGRYAETRHYKSIIKREKLLNTLPAIASRIPPVDSEELNSQLVTGSVVVSIDYFKRFVAGLRNIIGGRVSSYESLLDRARREAILRMKAEAKKLNAEYVFNIKLETSSIYKGQGKSIGSVEVLAYGTALFPDTV